MRVVIWDESEERKVLQNYCLKTFYKKSVSVNCLHFTLNCNTVSLIYTLIIEPSPSCYVLAKDNKYEGKDSCFVVSIYAVEVMF